MSATLEVGVVGVVRDGRRGDDRPAIVTKVGRRWAYLATNDEKRYDLGRCDRATGHLDGGRYGSPGTFLTPEQVALRAAVADAWEVVREAGFERRLGYGQRSDVLVLAVAETIKAHSA